MINRGWVYFGMAVAMAVSGSALLEAQKGSKGKPGPTPAVATFRCPGLECPTENPVTDGIQGDGLGPYDAADGATIDSLGELSLRPAANGRFLFLDFSYGSASCGAACRRTFDTLAIDSTTLAVFHTNVIDPATGAEAADGLRSIPVGATWPSRLKIAFNTFGENGEEILWAVRFNPRDYSPSDHIAIVRTGERTWEAFATDEERAMLVSSARRQKGYTIEGLYAMPFRVAITMP